MKNAEKDLQTCTLASETSGLAAIFVSIFKTAKSYV